MTYKPWDTFYILVENNWKECSQKNREQRDIVLLRLQWSYSLKKYVDSVTYDHYNITVASN